LVSQYTFSELGERNTYKTPCYLTENWKTKNLIAVTTSTTVTRCPRIDFPVKLKQAINLY
jgi:hypothetical protein